GFLMDSVGASLAFLISGMGNRGALAFFSFSTLKTVDDHCGYHLPFNPLQTLFSNNADYHDIHHQNFGIKSNFSQPFGTIWDHILGTHMSREEANKIIKMKEERKAARLAKQALDNASEALPVIAKPTNAPYGKDDDDVHSSGNNSGHDSHGEETHLGVRPRLEQRRASFQNKPTVSVLEHHLEDHEQLGLGEPSAVKLAPGLRERLSARTQLGSEARAL
ncbi:hypothetical protein BGZ52_005755, partial [Haplosporangium bisporale]